MALSHLIGNCGTKRHMPGLTLHADYRVLMKDADHTFPLPETETRKLDEVKEEIQHPLVCRVANLVRANPRQSVALAVTIGFMLGLRIGTKF